MTAKKGRRRPARRRPGATGRRSAFLGGAQLEVLRAAEYPGRFPWPKHLARLLGKLSDVEVARRAKLEAGAVRAERRRRGIAPFRQLRPPVEWTDEMLGLLGEASDGDVAAELGIGAKSVAYKRQLGVWTCPGLVDSKRVGSSSSRWWVALASTTVLRKRVARPPLSVILGGLRFLLEIDRAQIAQG